MEKTRSNRSLQKLNWVSLREMYIVNPTFQFSMRTKHFLRRNQQRNSTRTSGVLQSLLIQKRCDRELDAYLERFPLSGNQPILHIRGKKENQLSVPDPDLPHKTDRNVLKNVIFLPRQRLSAFGVGWFITYAALLRSNVLVLILKIGFRS